MANQSWVIVDRSTGKPMLETFSKATADAVDHSRFEVLTAHEWLVRLNRLIRDGQL